MNPDSFFSNLVRFGNEPAFIDRAGGRVIRYSELEAALPKVSGGIVATWAKTSLDHVLFLLAALREGALVAPISFRLPKSEAIERARSLGANGIWIQEDSACLRRIDLCAEDATGQINRPLLSEIQNPGTLLQTSGSSGRVRVLYHEFAAHIASAEGSATRLPLAPGCGWLLQLPLNHVSGFSIPIRCLLSGAAVVFSNSEYAVADGSVTHLSVVSTQLQRLLNLGASLHRLRAVLAGGGPISVPLVERAVCAGVPLHITYGMTEAASQICTTDRLVELPSILHVGRPLPGREIRIGASGEIQVRGPVLARKVLGSSGMWEDLADADGWFSTGDLGAFTPRGDLVIHGRRDRLIISGGENIQPELIESMLLELPGIRRAVVVGKSHPEFVERPVAFLAGDFEELEIRQILASRLERFAIPDKFLSWPEDIAEDLAKPDFAMFKRLADGI